MLRPKHTQSQGGSHTDFAIRESPSQFENRIMPRVYIYDNRPWDRYDFAPHPGGILNTMISI